MATSRKKAPSKPKTSKTSASKKSKTEPTVENAVSIPEWVLDCLSADRRDGLDRLAEQCALYSRRHDSGRYVLDVGMVAYDCGVSVSPLMQATKLCVIYPDRFKDASRCLGVPGRRWHHTAASAFSVAAETLAAQLVPESSSE